MNPAMPATGAAITTVAIGSLVSATVATAIGLGAVAAADQPCGPGGGSGGGAAQVANQPYNADQTTIAHTIVDTVADRKLPKRAAVLAIATGLVESGLRNLDHGDRDSLGVFQQRPSQGWGTPAQLLDPVYATHAFLDALIAIDGWHQLPDGVAEQRVQRSAFPDRYAPRHTEAVALVDKFWTGPNNPPPETNGQDRPTDSDQSSDAAVTVGCADEGPSDIPLNKTKVPNDFTLPDNKQQATAVAFAIDQIGKPYAWGAKGPDAFDCSGLMMAAWARAGIGIGAATTSQIHDGHAVTTIDALQPGDLVFIPGSLGTPANPRHVGMYIGHGLIVNAYDEDTGVVAERLTVWQDQIVAIRRVAGASEHGAAA